MRIWTCLISWTDRLRALLSKLDSILYHSLHLLLNVRKLLLTQNLLLQHPFLELRNRVACLQ